MVRDRPLSAAAVRPALAAWVPAALVAAAPRPLAPPPSTTTPSLLTNAARRPPAQSEDMQQDAIDTASQAMEKFNIEKDIAAYVKKEFDKKYGATWHAVVGRNFGSYVTHETKHFIYFYVRLGGPRCLCVRSSRAPLQPPAYDPPPSPFLFFTVGSSCGVAFQERVEGARRRAPFTGYKKGICF